MSCIQRSSCTVAKCQGCTAITLGIAIVTIIPLIIGCLGKYHVLSLGRPISKGMIISGSFGIGMMALVALQVAISVAIFRRNNFSLGPNLFPS